MIQLREPVMVSRPIQVQAPATREPSWLEIDLTRLDRNAAALRGLVGRGAPDAAPGPGIRSGAAASAAVARRPGQPLVCGAIKKNAYGLGAGPIAHRLAKAGCDMLAVYSPAEAEELVRQAVDCPLLLLMPLRELARTDVLYRHAVAGKLHLTVHDVDQVDDLNRIGQTFGIQLPVHLYLDTGMSRSGLSLGQLRHVLGELGQLRHLRVAGVYSHLATADGNPDFAYDQLACFERALADVADRLPAGAIRHIANTFGSLRDRRFHLDMIRPGLGLFGYGCELMDGPVLAEAPQLEPIVRWLSRVIHVQSYPNGSPVGYGATHTLRRDSILGIVPVGYGDGYPLALGNKAVVRVQPPDGARPLGDARVVGRVNMDQLIIDLTDVAAGNPAAMMNATVEVISDDPAAPNALPKLADLAGVHCYEMLCRLSPNLPRKYVR